MIDPYFKFILEEMKPLRDKVSDIDFWKSELRHENDLLVGETNSLQEVNRFYGDFTLRVKILSCRIVKF